MIRNKGKQLILAATTLLLFPRGLRGQGADPFELRPEFVSQAIFSCSDTFLNGNATVDSTGVTGSSGATGKGHLVSNGSITVNGGGIVRGDATAGPGKQFVKKGRPTITGKIGNLVSVWPCSPVNLSTLATTLRASNDNARVPESSKGNDPLQGSERTDFILSANESVTLSAGTYYFTSLVVASGAQLLVSATTRILCTGQVVLNGGASVNASGSPFALRIWSSGSELTVNGGAVLRAIFYAAQPDANVVVNGGGRVWGGLYGGKVTVNGGATVSRAVDDSAALSVTVTENGKTMADGALFSRNVTPVIASTGGVAPLTTQANLEGISFTSGTAVSTEGAHRLIASVRDSGGTTVSVSLSFTIDKTAPRLVILSPANGAVSATSPVDVYGTSDDALSVIVNGRTATVSSGSFVAKGVPLAEGSNILTVSGLDAAGNAGTATSRATLDTTAPVVVLAAPVDGLVTEGNSVTVSGTVSDGNLSILLVNGSPVGVSGGAFNVSVHLVEGPNTITVEARDGAGQATSRAIRVDRDSTPPVIRVEDQGKSLTDGALFARDVTPRIIVTDTHSTTVTASMDGGSFSSGATVQAEGGHILSVAARDSAGNQAKLSVRFTIDKTPPAVTITFPPPGGFLGSLPARVQGTCGDAVAVTVNGIVASVSSGQFVIAAFPFSEGTIGLTAVARDAAGNSAMATSTCTVDTQAPAVTISSPAPGAILGPGPIFLTGFAADANLGGVTVDGLAASVGSDGAFQSGPMARPDGPATLTAIATDRSGKSASASVSIVVDTTPPVISILNAATGAPLADGALFRAPVAVSVTVADATTQAGTTRTVLVDGTSYVGGAISGEGVHRVDVTARDGAGNSSAAAVSFTVDTVPPAFSDLLPADGTVTKTTPIVVSGKVSSDTTGVTVGGSPSTLSGGSFSLSALAITEGPNAIALNAVDRAGNVGTSTLRVVLDTIPPRLSITSPSAGQLLGSLSTAVIGTVSDANLEAVLVDGGSASVSDSTFRREGVTLLEGTNTVAVTARDRAGNTATATVAVVVDTKPPVLTVTSPAPGAALGATPVTVAGTALDPHLASVSVNGAAAVVDGAGRFTVSVPVTEGTNVLVATARDSLGHESTASVSVIKDSSAPVVAITSPRDGTLTKSLEIAVAGSIDSAANVSGVTVNGSPAVLAGTTFSATVSLLEGANPITARAAKGTGKEGTAGITITRDTTPPRLLSSSPADGQSGVALSSELRLTFTEALDPATVVSPAVELKFGSATVPLTSSAAGAVLTLTPASALHDSGSYVLSLSSGLRDLAGNPMSATTVRFSTVDQSPPGSPVLDPLPSATCARSLSLKGHAEPGAAVAVSGGAAMALGTAGADGRFSVDVTLLPETRQTLSATARDSSGNVSIPANVSVTADCTAPLVVDVARTARALTIRLDEALLGSTVRAGDTVRLDSSGGTPIPAIAALSADGTVLTLGVSGADLTAIAFTLSLSSGITDAAGNAIAPFIRSFGQALVATVLTGEVYDDSIGRPLPGATATVLISGGQTAPAPNPVSTSSSDGFFALPVLSGDALVRISAAGYLPVHRRQSVQTGASGEALSSTMFDARLTPQAPPATAGATASGFRYTSQRPSRLASGSVEAPAGALPDGAVVRITVRRPQGLPVLAPLGWSVAAAASLSILDSAGIAVNPAGSLTLVLPDFYGASASTSLAASHLDPVSLQWIYDGPASLRGADISVTTAATGDVAVFVPDPSPTDPPTPIPGSSLPDASMPADDPLQSATVVADPVDVVPSQTAEISLSVKASAPVPSGFPIQALVTEELTLLDGSRVSSPAFLSDLVLGRRGDGSTGLAIPLRASGAASQVVLSVGYERFAIRTFPFEVRRGAVVGTSGGTVTGPSGWSMTLPAGAVAVPTSVILTPLRTADLPQEIPAGFDLVGAVSVATGGASFALPGSLSLGLSAAPPAGRDLLLVQFYEAGGLVVLRPVARAVWDAAGHSIRTAPIDRSRFPWPGVAGEGTFAFLSAQDPLAFAAGHVLDVDGTPLGAVQVRVGGWPFVALTEKGGLFATSIRATSTTLSSVNPVTANGGFLTVVPASQGQELTGLDLHLEITAPFVSAVTPGAGSTVLVSTRFTVEFSEPVDPLSVTADSFFLAARLTGSSSQAVVVSGRTDLAPGGRSVSFIPSASLPGNTGLVLHVGRAVRDLTGYGMVDPLTKSPADLDVAFVTEDLTPPDSKPWLVTISPPSGDPADPVVTIAGGPGAVCGGCLVTAFNDTTLATAATSALSDGSFSTSLHARATDAIRIEVSKPNGTKQTLPSIPFSTNGGRSVTVSSSGGIWQTPEGYRIEVPKGAFSSAQTLVTSRGTQGELESLVQAPRDVTFVDSFVMDFDAPAASGFDLSFPAPGAGATGQFLLAQVVEVFGERRLMVVDLLGLKDGRLVTDRSGQNLQALRAAGWVALVDVTSKPGPAGRSTLSVAPKAGVRPVADAIGSQADRPSSFWDGVFKAGRYALYGAVVPMAYVAGPASGATLVASSSTSDFVFSGSDVLTRETFRLVVAAGGSFDLILRDASTGYTLFDGTLAAGVDTSAVTLVNPPLAVDASPPGVLAAQPATVHRFFAPPAGSSIAVTAPIQAATTTGPGGVTSVSVSGVTGASPKNAGLRLVNFSRSAGAGTAVSSPSDGSFGGLVIAASPSDRLALIVENTSAPFADPIKIQFDKPMASTGNDWTSLIRVERTTDNGRVVVDGERLPIPVPGDASILREIQFIPKGSFARGENYVLTVSGAAVDSTPARTSMVGDFVATFSSKKPASTADQTTGFVRKVLHRGGLVFETGEDNQVHVVDASTMSTGAFQRECDVVALPGTGRDMAFDGYGRLVVVGGGTGSLGFLKLFDLNAGIGCHGGILTPAGSAVVSNEVGGELLDFPPDGLPRRVSLIQSAETIAWVAGTDESKNAELSGLVLSPTGSQQTYRSALAVVSGNGREIAPAFPGQRYRRAVLTDLSTGESVRQLLDVRNGKAPLGLTLEAVTPGDRLRLDVSTLSFALVNVLGYGLALVDLEATYSQANDALPDITRPGIDARLAVVYDGSGPTGPKKPGQAPSCDAAQRISPDWTSCELFVAPPTDLAGFPVISDLLSLSDGLAHPVPNADGTVSVFGTLSHFGLVSFNLDLLGQARLHPLPAAQLFPLAGVDPLITKDHRIGITGVLPLMSSASGATGIGAARAVSLAVAPAWSRRSKALYCTDSLWRAGDGREERDLAFVAAGSNGVFVVDVTEPLAARTIGLYQTAGGALTVSVDAVRRLLYVGDAGAGVKVYDVSDPCGEPASLASGDDPRLVATFQFGAGGTSAGTSDVPVEIDPETGFAFASANGAAGTSGRLSAYQLGEPSLFAVADTDLDGSFEKVSRVIPLGVPNPEKAAVVGPDPATPPPGHSTYPPEYFRLLAFLPGGAGPTVEAEVASTGPEGTDLPASSPGFPPSGFVAKPVLLKRQSDDPSEPAFDRFLSDPIVVLADPRAQMAYLRTSEEKDLPGEPGAGNPNACRNCDLSGDLERAVVFTGVPGASTARRLELWSGDRIRIALAESVKAKLPYLTDVDLRASGISLSSIRGDLTPSLRQRPVLSGNTVSGISTHSGEYSESGVDLAVPGRGLAFAVDRTYSSQAMHDGPLGRNVDSSLFERLRLRPARGADGEIHEAGEVDWFDGSARRLTFVWQTASSRYDSPAGFASTLTAGNDGRFYLESPDGSTTVFDAWGRKTIFQDRHVTKADGSDGNRHLFVRDGTGRLVAVEDDLGRRYELSYDGAGRVSALTDFDQRAVTYGYDDLGRLSSVQEPSPDSAAPRRLGLAASTQPGTSWSYTLATAQSDVASLLKLAPQIETITDGNGAVPLRIGWDPARPGVAGRATTIDGTTQLSIDTVTGKTVVTDPLSAVTAFSHDADGHVTSVKDPLGNATVYTYTGGPGPDGSTKADGLLASVQVPGGQTTTFSYDTRRIDRRGQFNLLEQRRKAIALPGQQTPPELVTTMDQYEAHGFPGRITAPDGSVTTVVRNGRGDPVSIAQPGTSSVTLGVDPYGRVTTVTQLERTETRTYDAPTGQLSSVSVAGAGTTTYSRDARGNAISVLDAAGTTTTYAVDRLDRAVKETRGGGPGAGVTTYTYDALSQVKNRSSLTGFNADGKAVNASTDYVYDALGRMTSRSSPATGPTSYSYDGQGNLKIVNAPGGRTTTYQYDSRGLLTGIQEPPTATCPGGPITRFAYNPNGTRTGSTDPAGGTTTYLLDGHDRVTGSLSPSGVYTSSPPDLGGRAPVTKLADRDAQGTPLSIYRWSEQQYDQAGRVIKEVRKLFTSPIPAPGSAAATTDSIAETRYDGAGRVTDTIDPLGRVTHTDHDDAGRPVRVTDPAGNQTVTEYDPAGRTAKTTVRELRADSGFDEFVTSYTYDDQGRVLTLTAPGNRVAAYEYDPAGQKTKETAPDGATHQYFYDLAGRKVREVDPIGAETKWDYDLAGNLAKLTDANGHATTFAYDASGRLVTETRPDGKSWTRTYDCAGNEATFSTPSGIVVAKSYDLEGRLTGRRASGGMLPTTLAETVTYDLLGRPVRKTASGGSSDVETRFAFDSLDRLLSETTKIGAGPDRTVARTYDLAGNATQMTYPSGRVYTLAVDPLDRLKSITRKIGSVRTPIASWEDIGGRQVKKTLGNGLVETMAYGAEPWLQAIDVRPPAATAPILGIDYGQRTATGYKVDVTRTDRSRRNHYAYDLAGRITNEQLGFVVPPPAPPAPNLPAVDVLYTLDPVLNTQKRDRTEGGTTISTTGTVDTRNRVTQWGSDTPAWDADGNLSSFKGTTLSYTLDSHLTKATLQNGDSIEFLYDPDGRKVRESKTVGGTKVETDFVQSGQQVVETYPKDGATPTKVYVHGRGVDEVAQADFDPAASGTSKTIYPLQDELGNVTHLTDQNGQVLERYEYEGYGKFRIFDPNGAALSTSAYGWTRLFQGREYIPMLDAYDFRARTLWPELGRFGQEDPAGTHDSTNRYQALGGRWTGLTDPRGLWEEDVHHWLTTYLAQAAGFGDGVADTIGRATGMPDFDERDAMYPEGLLWKAAAWFGFPAANERNMKDLHFAPPHRIYALESIATPERNKGNIRAIGEFLHAFQDSYSHQANEVFPDSREAYDDRIGPFRAGHGCHGHDPDQTWKRSEAIRMRMVDETFAFLRAFRQKIYGRGGADTASLSADQRRSISRFMEKPQDADLYHEAFAGGLKWAESVRDYSEKIRRLDTRFSPTPYERADRERKYAETRAVERRLQDRADLRTMH